MTCQKLMVLIKPVRLIPVPIQPFDQNTHLIRRIPIPPWNKL